MENQFGRTSELRWKAVEKDGRTILQDVYFTSPYKIMNPFEQKDGSISVMLLSASAGVMAGDTAAYDFRIGQGAKIEFLSQSYEKIHKMEEGKAVRRTHIQVEENAQFYYHPLPVIPFAGSNFENETTVELKDDSSQFEYYEILACGRSARQELFEYQKFQSCLNIRKGGHLIFRDNSIFLPKQFPMGKTGFYEGYTHLANFLFCNRGKDEQWANRVKELLNCQSGLNESEDAESASNTHINRVNKLGMRTNKQVEGGVTRLESGDYLVKILGKQAQKLQDLGEIIGKL